MERLAATPRATYRRIVYEHPRFIDYFHAATPEAELARLNIGSRPARRGGGRRVASLRAIPWQFAWTQTRLMLGAWLGVEDALDRAIARGERDAAAGDVSRVAALPVGDRSDRDGAGEGRRADRRRIRPPAGAAGTLQPIGADLRARLQRAIDGDAARSPATRELLESNPVLRRSIDVRNPYVDPINLVQVELLRRCARLRTTRACARRCMVTINGIAAGMRNTG